LKFLKVNFMDKVKTTQVIGIASGKGGVGKTTVSVNLAVALQAMGFRVMLFDADMSLANAQIALGCRCPYNLSHFLSGEKTLAEIIVTTRQGVKLVPGASGIQDYLIVDMAAGISPEVLSFMAACSRRFVVVRDDPSSIADAYATIKVLIQDQGLDEIYLIPNGVDSAQEGYQLFERINQVCARFLNRTVRYLGAIEQDDLILTALKKYQPVAEYAPGSAGARDFRRLAEATRQLEPIQEASGGLQFFVERLVKAKA
jgi:flagellar biosynthesis protein FlhG